VPIDWSLLTAEGIRFVGIKVSERARKDRRL
jgi:hypothetical protein